MALDACYLVATSRWGSYVGVPHHPVYIGDLIFGVSLLLWVVGGGIARLWTEERREPLVWATAALLAWTVVRLALGTINTVALRDAAPYLYLVAIPVLLTVPISRRVLGAMLTVAVTFHVAYVAVQLHDPTFFAHMPTLGPTHAFDRRDDFDEAVIGVGIAIGIALIVRGRGLLRRAAGAGLAGVACWDISQMSNRGGLLAAAACVAAAAVALPWDQLRVRPHVPPRPALMVGVGLALCAATSVAFVQSPALHRLNNTFYSASTPGATASPTPTPDAHSGRRNGSGASSSDSAGRAGAGSGQSKSPSKRGSGSKPTPGATPTGDQVAAAVAGTTRARRIAWEDVYHYTTRTASRAVFGVGFGPNFLQSAGALQLLSGGLPGLRAPHDIFLNTWARLGLIGLVIHALLLLLGLLAATRYVLRRGVDAAVPAVLLVVALPLAALVGVILESPFGAIPFAVAVGWLAAARRTQPRALAGADPVTTPGRA